MGGFRGWGVEHRGVKIWGLLTALLHLCSNATVECLDTREWKSYQNSCLKEGFGNSFFFFSNHVLLCKFTLHCGL